MALQNVADTYTKEARERVLLEVAGIWNERKDLPDYAAMRSESDVRFE